MIAQVLRFSFVGAAATLIHLLVGVTLIHAGWVPALANAAAFCVAFFVSFAGHFGYTFSGQSVSVSASLMRFVALALAGFTANEAILAGTLAGHLLPPAVALVLSTGLVALASFVLCRRWAFAAPVGPGGGCS